MEILEYDNWLSSEDPALWEMAYNEYVSKGLVSVDEWVMLWLWNRLKMPADQNYSLFRNNILIDAVLIDTRIRLIAEFDGKIRYVHLEMYFSGSLHPEFECDEKADSLHLRFESIGNPFIDEPNYQWWEKYLILTLCARLFLDQGGLDVIIESIRRHH